MKGRLIRLALGTSIIALAAPAVAQGTGDEGAQGAAAIPAVTDSSVPVSAPIIVTARRRSETLQDVPLAVDAVTSADIDNLNLQQFEDVAKIIPGLSLDGTNVSVRGIAFNQIVSGNSSTIGFYLNDSPVPATALQQGLFDIGQIELLRGPQGTLRGKASPSGAMTLTTRRPDLYEVGGYTSMDGTVDGDLNFNGAVGVPLIPGKLAVRIAGIVIDGPESSEVRSLNSGIEARESEEAVRGTVVFEPLDNLSLIFTAQKYWARGRRYQQVESLEALDSNSAVTSPRFIEASDRLALQDTPQRTRNENEFYNLQARYSLAGQQLDYVGQIYKSIGITRDADDVADVFGPSDPDIFQGYGQFTDIRIDSESHEIRLSSQDRLLGMLDYVVGYFHQTNESPTSFIRRIPLLLPPIAGGPQLLEVGNDRNNKEVEESFFGNLTLYLGDSTELSGGARHISFKKESNVVSGGAILFPQEEEFDTWIWTASAKHEFTDDLMAYATVGTSWRPGQTLIGLQGDDPSPRQLAFTMLQPEKSTSYEVGVKSSFLDQRLTLNLAAFFQEFKNYPYRSSAAYVALNDPGPDTLPTSSAFGFATGVPAEVYGGELQMIFDPTDNWNISAGVAYAKSEVKNGTIACNDYEGGVADGVPDDSTGSYTLAEILAATGGQGVGACVVDGIPISLTPKWSGYLQSEYSFPVSDKVDVFGRGLLNWYGDSTNDFNNPIDDIDSYALLNLYAGIRDASGRWELSVYGKNITNTERVLGRSQSPINPPVSSQPATGYRTITNITDPREFGLNIRYAFGSR